MICLVVGLSGVGKTALCEWASEILPNVRHVDLDKRIDARYKYGDLWPEFGELCRRHIEQIEGETRSGHVLIDIGGAFFKDPAAFGYLDARRGVVVAVDDNPDAIFERLVKRHPCGFWSKLVEAVGLDVGKERHRKEFTEEVRILFSTIPTSQVFCVTGKSEEDAKRAFVEFLGEFLGLD